MLFFETVAREKQEEKDNEISLYRSIMKQKKHYHHNITSPAEK